jgi:hypothetical protein
MDEMIGGNLSVTGETTLIGNLMSANINNSGKITTKNLMVTMDEMIGGNLSVTGETTLIGNLMSANINNTGKITTKNLIVTMDEMIGGNLVVTGETTLIGNLMSANINNTGKITTKNLMVTMDEMIGGNLSVTGETTLIGNLMSANINNTGKITTKNLMVTMDEMIGGNLSVTGETTLIGNLMSANINNTGKITTKNLMVTMDEMIGGNLTVTGFTTTINKLVLNGNIDMQCTHSIQNANIVEAKIIRPACGSGNIIMDGNVLINKTLTVTGNTTLGNLSVNTFNLMGCLRYLMGTVQTTTATAGTTIVTIPIKTNTVYLIKTRLLALRNTFDTAAAFDWQRAYKNNAGTVTQVGGTDNVQFQDNGTYGMAYVISGTDVLINVIKTGGAQTINWSACIETYEYTP